VSDQRFCSARSSTLAAIGAAVIKRSFEGNRALSWSRRVAPSEGRMPICGSCT
jgi:hypothetical protein